MLKLVVHHTYRNGRATDVSGRSNHGVATATQSGTGDFSSALRFFGPSRVIVPLSPDLQNLDALRVKVRCMWTPSSFSFDRHNEIISGALCFQLMVAPGGVLLAMIRDATATWYELKVPGVGMTNQWRDIELRHDGHATMELRVDGQVVAARYDVQGPIGSIAPLGIAVGHTLIKTNHLRSFDGWIDDVQLAKRELEVEDALDRCCADLPKLGDAVEEARAAGMTPDEARAFLRRVRALDAEIRVAAIDGDRVRAERLSHLAQDGVGALQAADARGLASAVARTADFVRERVADNDILAFGHRAVGLLEDGPHGHLLRAALDGQGVAALAPVSDLIAALCFPRPPAAEPRPDPGPILLTDGDPDTDGPPIPPPTPKDIG